MGTALYSRPIGFVTKSNVGKVAEMRVGVRLWPSAEQIAAEARLAAQKLAALRKDRHGRQMEQPQLGINRYGDEVVIPGDFVYRARPDDQPTAPITESEQDAQIPKGYTLKQWFSWFSESLATRRRIKDERADRDTRLAALASVGTIPAELTRVLSEDWPQNVEPAMDPLRGILPWKTIEQLFTDVIRIHPSSTVRTEAQKAILAEDPYAVRIEDLPEVREDDPPQSVLKAAALMEGQWSIFTFKKLVAKEAWPEAAHVLRSSDHPYRQDFAYVLWHAMYHVEIPKKVGVTAYAVLPPHALIWKSRMKKVCFSAFITETLRGPQIDLEALLTDDARRLLENVRKKEEE